MEPATWNTGADGSAVLTALNEALVAQGYTVTPDETGWAGRAEVGSKAARALAGGFARRMVLDYAVSQGDQEGTTKLVVAPASSGWSGGAMGASKAKKEMANVASAVHQMLAERQLLVG
ncbi:MAG TPA: hypothetical protein VF228_24845 [Iamia sp.]